MKITAAAAAQLAVFFGLATGSPLAPRAACNISPPGPANGNVSPISQPAAGTGSACQAQCRADTRCQSFTFGLPPSESSPRCRLFGVPASQVPGQGAGNNVFDRGCEGVPNTTPTREEPIGRP